MTNVKYNCILERRTCWIRSSYRPGFRRDCLRFPARFVYWKVGWVRNRKTLQQQPVIRPGAKSSGGVQALVKTMRGRAALIRRWCPFVTREPNRPIFCFFRFLKKPKSHAAQFFYFWWSDFKLRAKRNFIFFIKLTRKTWNENISERKRKTTKIKKSRKTYCKCIYRNSENYYISSLIIYDFYKKK